MVFRFIRRRLFKIIVVSLCIVLLWTFFGFRVSSDDDYDDDDDHGFPHDLEYDVFNDETKDSHEHLHVPLDEEMNEDYKQSWDKIHNRASRVEDPTDPIILWWTKFTLEPGKARKCGEKSCFFTNDRKYSSHDNMKAFMFYGTDFNPRDLPLPRQDHHEWALFHEESPKNNLILSHGDALSLFNHTSTFRRESDFPISTQHLLSLEWLEQKKYLKTISEKNSYQKKDMLSPIVFVQSDCDPPSDRDAYVKMLMKHIPIDSYGLCLNNKNLPEKLVSPLEGMAHTDFYELLSHYKFAISMENAVCKDYMTEKLWRPLMVGTVPIIFGSPDVKDFLPDDDSALVINDFETTEQLGLYLQDLNKDDAKYEKMRSWKSSGIKNDFLRKVVSSRPWTPDDGHTWVPGQVNFIEAYECHVCNKIHENLEREVNGYPIIRRWANVSHYGCPKRKRFDGSGKYNSKAGWLDFWESEWDRQINVAKALKECVEKKLAACKDFIKIKLQKLQKKKDF